jgi:hypothetical protein
MKLQYDEQLSNCAFNFNLRRYKMEAAKLEAGGGSLVDEGMRSELLAARQRLRAFEDEVDLLRRENSTLRQQLADDSSAAERR